MSDTPRTDAVDISCSLYSDIDSPLRDMTEHARQLERELADAKDELGLTRGTLESVERNLEHALPARLRRERDELLAALELLVRDVEDLERERDELLKALEVIKRLGIAKAKAGELSVCERTMREQAVAAIKKARGE